MKKIRIFVLMFVLLSALVLAACSGGFKKYAKNISEYRDDVLVGSNDNFSLHAVTGYRENPFEIDGISGEKCDFFLVTVTPSKFDPTAEYKYKVTLGGVEYKGDLVKHPFEYTYSFEVEARCNDGEATVYIDDSEIQLNSVKSEFITPEKAFDIALKRLSDTETVKNGNYEIYIRLIENPINAAGGYFWYVAFVDCNEATCAVLIDPISMEITAVRE